MLLVIFFSPPAWVAIIRAWAMCGVAQLSHKIIDRGSTPSLSIMS